MPFYPVARMITFNVQQRKSEILIKAALAKDSRRSSDCKYNFASKDLKRKKRGRKHCRPQPCPHPSASRTPSSITPNFPGDSDQLIDQQDSETGKYSTIL